jgi:hypothetical protein
VSIKVDINNLSSSFSRESWSLCALTLMWMKENPLLYRSIYLSIPKGFSLLAGCFIRQYMHDGVVVFWDTHKYSLLVLVVVLGAWSCMIVAAAAPVFSSFPLLKHWWNCSCDGPKLSHSFCVIETLPSAAAAAVWFVFAQRRRAAQLAMLTQRLSLNSCSSPSLDSYFFLFSYFTNR